MPDNAVTIPPRRDIRTEFTWNAPSVFADLKAWEAELRAIGELLAAFKRYQGRLAESPAVLADAIDALNDIQERAEKALVFAGMSYYVDTGDQHAADMFSRGAALFSRAQAVTSFFEPDVLAIGEETIQAWLKTEPHLRKYEHLLANLFRKQAHIRSSEVEELLGMLGDPFSNVTLTASILTDADFRFKPATGQNGEIQEVTQGTWETILRGADREARRTAWENYRDQYLAYQNTLASNLSTSLKQSAFMMRARGHDSTLAATLFEPNIPTAVYHNLIDTFRRQLPIWHRYWEIRRRALGVERLHPYDIWAPLTDSPPTIPFEEGLDLICEALQPLGDDYISAIRRGCLEDRWVDRYPNQGKTAGAFSWGSKGTLPFIVLSYDDTVYSVSTLAHELGHSMHSYLTWQHQPALYCDYSLFVAEVASNFNQALLREHLLNANPDPDFQISVIEEAMWNYHRYFLIMPTLARFELAVHESVERGEGLTADKMNELTADLFAEAYGDSMHIDRARLGVTWATFGHLYTDYYVFQYATGISGAHALVKRVLEQGSADDYLAFLSAGASLYPLEALQLAGVDLASPVPVEQAFADMAAMIDRLESLLSARA